MTVAHAGDLAALAREGSVRLFLQFGGQGAGWFTELAEHWADDRARPVIEACLDAIDEELPFVDPAVLPSGLDARAWLTDPAAVPDRRYLSLASVSIPLIFVTQMACVRRLLVEGPSADELLAATVAASGQSQGLFPACALAAGAFAGSGDQTLRSFAKYAFFIGSRSQEAYPLAEATEEEMELSMAATGDPAATPTPMAAVAGGDAPDLERRVRRFNAQVPATDRIHLSLRFADDRLVLSGHRRALAEFGARHAADFRGAGVKYVWVRTSCPFHSPLMDGARARLEADFARVRFRVPGRALAVPVRSCADGRNLQYDQDLARTLHLDAVIRALDWSAAVDPAAAEEVTHVLDFGPGAETRHRTRRLLEARGAAKPVLAARKLLADSAV